MTVKYTLEKDPQGDIHRLSRRIRRGAMLEQEKLVRQLLDFGVPEDWLRDHAHWEVNTTGTALHGLGAEMRIPLPTLVIRVPGMVEPK